MCRLVMRRLVSGSVGVALLLLWLLREACVLFAGGAGAATCAVE